MSISSSFKKAAAVSILMAAPLAAFAQSLGNLQQIAQSSLSILNIVITIVFVLAILVFGWGVVKYVASAGDPAKEAEARQFLWWGVIGIFVLASVFGLVKFIGSSLNVGQEQGTITIPRIQPNQ
jgi:branched-subunit amino acid permease